MADTFTTYYNLTKPQVGGDPDTWGNLLNSNFDTIDTQIHNAAQAAANALPLSGGTLTGPLTLPAAGLTLNSPSAAGRWITIETNGSPRWSLGCDGATESGSDSGSNFVIFNYADNGNYKTTPLSINRASGAVSFSVRPSFNGATPWDSSNFNPSNYAALNSGPTFTGAVTTNYQFVSKTGTNAWSLSAHNADNSGTYGGVWVDSSSGVALIQANGFYGITLPVSGNIRADRAITAPDFQATSDARLKTEVQALQRGLAELARMPPRQYRKDGKPEIGFIAQEVREVLPEAVTEDSNGFLSVSYGQLVALLAQAVLQLDERVSALEAGRGRAK